MENITNINGMQEEELEQAKVEAKNAENLFKLKLKKPLSYEGTDYTELSFDFDNLTGRDSLDVERELAMRAIQVAVPAFSGEYIIRIAAKACTEPLGSDAFEAMSLRDYNRLRGKVRNFLMASE
jgi:hypothetical protein